MQYIEYKGEKLPLKFSFIAMKNYNKESGKDIINGIDHLDFDDIELLFKCAYQSGCKSEGIEQKFTDIESILDDTYHEFIELIPKLMAVDKKKSTPKPVMKKR